MKSPREPDGQPDDGVPSEVAEAFRVPGRRLDAPSGRYETLRRRAAVRRRRRALAVVAAAACCAGAGVLGGLAARSTSDVVRTRDVADAPPTPAPTGSAEPAPARRPSLPPVTPRTTRPSTTPPGRTRSASPPATVSQAPPPPARTTKAPVRGCASSSLRVTAGRGSGAAGSVLVPLVFTNTGTRACTLHGFPGVSLVDASGGQIGAAATRTGAGGGSVVLAPGHAAVAQVRVTRAQNYPQERCAPVAAQGLRVYPPGETHALLVPREGLTGCAETGVRLLSVRTVGPVS